MSGNLFENYSNLGYYQAFSSSVAGQIIPTANGDTIDLQGAKAVTFLVNVGSVHFAAASALHVCIQHGLASAAGVSAWSLCGNSQLIHSVAGGYDSTASTGLWHSFATTDDSTVFACGYKMDHSHRYVRLYFSGDGGTGSMIASAIAIVEYNEWPVNTPINT